jgi:hypothetical protein
MILFSVFPDQALSVEDKAGSINMYHTIKELKIDVKAKDTEINSLK